MTSDPPRSRTLAVDVLLNFLKAEGASVVFGVPGGLLHPFFAAVEADPDMRLIVAKHEGGSAFMADGYARFGRRLAVCAATGGPGATNLLTGVACAFADGVPMLVLTGQVATSSQGKGALQDTNREDIDIVDMFRPVTKYSAMVTSASQLTHHLRRALRCALTGRNGPVHLCIPIDLWTQALEDEWFNPKTYRPDTRTFDRTQVHRAASALIAAKKPVILAGGGVWSARAEEQLRALAELLPARVATTPRGKGIFPEDHPLSLGVLGFSGHADARDTILGGGTDALLTAGASLNETTTLRWHPGLRPDGPLIQLDIDADRIGRNYPVDVPLVGDAQTIMLEIVYDIHRQIREGVLPASTWNGAPPLRRGHDRFVEPHLRTSMAVPVTPQRWRADLEEVLPTDAVIYSDMGGHTLFNVHDLIIGGNQRFVVNMGLASMGHGTCAPIGAALAAPERTHVTIIGDACFTMNGMELLTAAEYKIPVIWIVENNNMHGITWHGSRMVGDKQPLQAIRYPATLEVAAIARAMGLNAYIIDAPGKLQDVFLEAIASRGPSLIEIRVDPMIPPPLKDRALSISTGMNS